MIHLSIFTLEQINHKEKKKEKTRKTKRIP